MIFKKLIGKTYLWDLETNEVHDLKRFKMAECKDLVLKIKRKNRKYITFIKFLDLFTEGTVHGCTHCLSGFDKSKTSKL